MNSPQRMIQSEALLRGLLEVAIAAAQPAQAVLPHLPPAPRGRTIVLGAGKAAAAMAQAVERHMTGALEGLVVTRYGHGAECSRIEVVEAAHPVPDAAGRAAAGRILALADAAGPDDLVLCLISGGASSLLTLPAPGLSLADKQAVNRALLASGADIGQMNVVRKHLSAIKGGRLAAAAHPARVVSLLISDVPGDDPAVIGSGPTVPDPSTFADARGILARHGIAAPPAVAAHLAAAAEETPKPGDPRLATATTIVVARPQAALEAAAARAQECGFAPVILGDAIEGEAREVAKVMAGIALQARRHGQPAAPPCVLLSGGETTVTVRGKGRGGRNAEFLLALAVQLNGAAGISALAADTDGIDGSEDNAGALLTPDTLARARALGLDASARLADNDGYGFFSALGDLVVTGPTLTNVNDFRAILVDTEWGDAMRSYQIVEWGQPIELREQPTPTPVGTEVLLRVTAAGICHSDLHINDGYFDLGDGKRAELAKLGATLPLTLGHEIVGVVEALGLEAEGVALGDARVAFPWIGCRTCAICRHEREQWCMTPKFLGARVPGGYSDHVIVPHPAYLIAYDGVPTPLACTYACAGLTAYSAIRKVAPLREDDYLVLIGAGGVGLSGVHIAPAVVPAKLIVADVDPEKRAVARQAGAFETIDNNEPDAAKRVLELTKGGVKAAIDFVGAPATARFGMDVLRKGGTLVVVGLYGGALAVPLPLLPQRSLSLRGSYVGTLEEMHEVMALGRAGRVPPLPLDLRPLDAAPRALADLRAGRVRGRVILQP